jgi:hypothetical protein
MNKQFRYGIIILLVIILVFLYLQTNNKLELGTSASMSGNTMVSTSSAETTTMYTPQIIPAFILAPISLFAPISVLKSEPTSESDNNYIGISIGISIVFVILIIVMIGVIYANMSE